MPLCSATGAGVAQALSSITAQLASEMSRLDMGVFVANRENNR
jgi:hypothetical protein